MLSRSLVREQDLSLKLLLEDSRSITAIAHAAMASRTRYAAGLSPLALYTFTLSPTRKGFRLDEAQIEQAFVALLGELKRNSAAMAATALCAEISEAAPTDGELFLLLGELYARLTERPPEDAAALLVKFVLEALSHAGHGLVLDRCVRCDSIAPGRARTTVSLYQGGVVCMRCGGGEYPLSAADRNALLGVYQGELSAIREGSLGAVSALMSGFAPKSAEVLSKSLGLFSKA